MYRYLILNVFQPLSVGNDILRNFRSVLVCVHIFILNNSDVSLYTSLFVFIKATHFRGYQIVKVPWLKIAFKFKNIGTAQFVYR
jgi:hypothetical protein